jgi:uncharacterized membrane protein
VSQSYSVEVEISSPIRDLSPGEDWEFRATVTNKGNGNDKLRISLSGTNNKWATLDRSLISLNASEKQTVTITVKVPASALSTDEALITVKASSEYGSATDSASIEVYVKQNHAVTASLSEDTINIKKGETKEDVATITITNDGNGPDTFRISFSGDIAGYLRTNTPKVDLQPGEVREVKISIDVAESAESGVASGLVIVASTKSVAKEQMDLDIDIEGESTTTGIPEIDLYLLIGIVVVIAIIVGLAVASSRGKKGRVNGGAR